MKSRKEHGKATIVLLMGTSSAGKGTIIKEMKRQDSLKPESERLNWQEECIDIEVAKRNNNLNEERLKIINADPRSAKIFNDLKMELKAKILSSLKKEPNQKQMENIEKDIDEDVMLSIFYGRLTIGNQSIKLLSPFDIDGFIKNLSPKEASKYTAENIKTIQELALKHYDAFHAITTKSDDRLLEGIFMRAQWNSVRGIPTIIEALTFPGGEDMVKIFNKFMNQNNFSCPVIFALAHCNINKIAEHLDKRNASDDRNERREGFAPFRHYGYTYRAAKEGDREVGQLTINGILGVAQKYDTDKKDSVVSLENSNATKSLIKYLGIEEGSSLDRVVKVTPKFCYDIVYQTDPELTSEEKKDARSTSEDATISIAKQLNKLATRNSTYKEVPTAKIIKNHFAKKRDDERFDSFVNQYRSRKYNNSKDQAREL